MPDPLAAVSPLDGRYASRTAPLAAYASEGALLRARTHVEIEYLIALADLDAIDFILPQQARRTLRAIYESFDADDAALAKQIETEGYGPYAATNHDVKAVEYFIRERAPDDLDIDQWIHFGLTSEDVNNLAHRLLLKGAMTEVLLPALADLHESLVREARAHHDVAMLAHTHGQPATPTTYGKELAVFANRLDATRQRAESAVADLSGKLAGASGTYAAHEVAVPAVDWPAFSASFVQGLGFDHTPLTTQVNPCDDIGRLFDALARINQVVIDLDRDIWLYVSKAYLGQSATSGETGSSTMPHKVNPIDFENSEGNLSKATADLRFLADYVTTSRLQRDLSDSTVKRNIGSALAHCLIGYEKTMAGMQKVEPNEVAMATDLSEHPEVLGEAIQTVLRWAGHDDAYERLKATTRGRSITLEDLHAVIVDADLPDSVEARLLALTPADYVGRASALVAELDE